MNTKHLLAKELWRIGSIKKGQFKLSSGKTSTIYIDLRTVPSHPQVFRLALSLLHAETYQILQKTDIILGVATGGITWATGLSLLAGKPLGYIRPKQKGHGLDKLVEAGLKGSAIIVDDVATTGMSLARAVRIASEAGYRVNAAAVIVDRGEGARERLGEIGVSLISVLGMEDVMGAGVSP